MNGVREIELAALATELRIVIGRLMRRLREEAGVGDITAPQKAVLMHLERAGNATVTELAKAEGMKPQSVGATVATLQAAGWVLGSPDPADGRRTILSLSEACRERIRVSREKRDDWLLQAIEAKLSDSQQQELIGAVEALRKLLD